MLVLHGLLGSAANWRSFARRWVAATPDWGLVLVDLRKHGESQDAPPPHTLAAAADDLVALGETLALPIRGVLGHSFGGKVALAYADRAQDELESVWVLDASPSARSTRGSSTEAVLELLRRLPARFASREAFVQHIVAEGQPRGIAEWLAMNLRSSDEGFRFRLDLDAIMSLFESFRATDLWHVLEGGGARAFHVVVAGRSDAFDESDRARLAELARSGPRSGARVHEHVMPSSGHWIHVDQPDALLDLVTRPST
jgi:pimeloyl-ACP methyl ester carboxylesterase